MNVSLLELFWIFTKIGCCMFGGGIVILPLLEKEAVQARGWLTSEELVEYYSISQLIPGINAPDVSMFVGYKLRGKLGAVVAGLGVIWIPFILIVSLSFVLAKLIGFSYVKSAFWGIDIGTVVILSVALRSIWKVSVVDKFTLLYTFFIFLLFLFTNISPAIIVVFALLLGFAKAFINEKKEKQDE